MNLSKFNSIIGVDSKLLCYHASKDKFKFKNKTNISCIIQIIMLQPAGIKGKDIIEVKISQYLN